MHFDDYRIPPDPPAYAHNPCEYCNACHQAGCFFFQTLCASAREELSLRSSALSVLQTSLYQTAYAERHGKYLLITTEHETDFVSVSHGVIGCHPTSVVRFERKHLADFLLLSGWQHTTFHIKEAGAGKREKPAREASDKLSFLKASVNEHFDQFSRHIQSNPQESPMSMANMPSFERVDRFLRMLYAAIESGGMRLVGYVDKEILEVRYDIVRGEEDNPEIVCKGYRLEEVRRFVLDNKLDQRNRP